MMQTQSHRIIVPPEDKTYPRKQWILKADTELRLVVNPNERVSISLVSGQAEVFGREITADQPLILTNSRLAIYAIKDSVILVLCS